MQSDIASRRINAYRLLFALVILACGGCNLGAMGEGAPRPL